MEKKKEEEEKKKRRKIRSGLQGGEGEGRRQGGIGVTLLCVAAQNSLISILLPLLVSITPSGSLKEGGYQ